MSIDIHAVGSATWGMKSDMCGLRKVTSRRPRVKPKTHFLIAVTDDYPFPNKME
ncbi:MAG TPA: hypothetical protein VGJ64_02355 [Gemmatimonadaceae bacterium]